MLQEGQHLVGCPRSPLRPSLTGKGKRKYFFWAIFPSVANSKLLNLKMKPTVGNFSVPYFSGAPLGMSLEHQRQRWGPCLTSPVTLRWLPFSSL